MSDYDLTRAHQLRDDAREQACRFKRERDDARAELQRLRDVAELGRAVAEMVEQLDRLRRQPRERTGFSFDVAASVNAVQDELAEVLAETPGGDLAKLESGDVLSAAMQLVLVQGESPLRAITQVTSKMRERLDMVETLGISWQQAKVMLREGSQ